MSFLPIVERELRVRARQKSTYRFRLGGALAAIVIGGLLMATGQVMATPGTLGSGLFAFLGWLVYGYCLLEGARNTADCLSEEKRAGTLGLLFLTDLKGYDVVLGKLMATSLNSFYGLLAIFPPLAIPLVLGGVTGGEFWRVVLALMNALFFSLAAGMAVSAASRLERRAWGGTVAIVFFFAAIPPLLRWLPFLAGSDLRLVSPTAAFLGAFDLAYTASPDDYWRSLLFINLLSWAFLVAASCVLPQAWQDRPARTANPWLRRIRWSRFWPGQARRRRSRQRLLNTNPVAWLAGREEEQQTLLWIFVAVVCVVALGIWLPSGKSGAVGAVLFASALAVHVALALWVASQACHTLAEARDSGLLELMLTAPLGEKQIVAGHVEAQHRFFLGPVALLAAVEAIILIGQVSLSGGSTFRTVSGIAIGELWFALLITDLFAVSRFGLWMGLTSRKPSQALGKTVLYVLVLPMLGTLCCWFFWPLLGMVKNLVFINFAREELRGRFRKVAADRFASGPEGGGLTKPARRKTPPRLPSVLPP